MPSGRGTGSRNAAHPVNAIMNYAYAALQSQVQIKAVAEGYDPMLGVMHHDRDGAPGPCQGNSGGVRAVLCSWP
jgi:CRISPR/Cas system-associated endonuclease Cas1